MLLMKYPQQLLAYRHNFLNGLSIFYTLRERERLEFILSWRGTGRGTVLMTSMGIRVNRGEKQGMAWLVCALLRQGKFQRHKRHLSLTSPLTMAGLPIIHIHRVKRRIYWDLSRPDIISGWFYPHNLTIQHHTTYLIWNSLIQCIHNSWDLRFFMILILWNHGST